MRWPLSLSLLVVIACSESRVTPTADDLSVSPGQLELGAVARDEEVHVELELRNGGLAARNFLVQEQRALGVLQHQVVVEPGTRLERLPLRFSRAGDYDEPLIVSSDNTTFLIAVRAQVFEPPACASDDPCKVNERAGAACSIRDAADGTPCANSCLENGACLEGRCVGSPRSCDDNNACTADFCSSSQGGCGHSELACAVPSNPCQVSRCDPLRGCVTEPVADFSACGQMSCAESRVCIAGSCVTRPTPDGTLCSEPTCEGAGRCSAGKCVRPLRGESEAWVIGAGETGDLTPSETHFAELPTRPGEAAIFFATGSAACGYATRWTASDGGLRWWRNFCWSDPDGEPLNLAYWRDEVLIPAGGGLKALDVSDGGLRRTIPFGQTLAAAIADAGIVPVETPSVAAFRLLDADGGYFISSVIAGLDQDLNVTWIRPVVRADRTSFHTIGQPSIIAGEALAFSEVVSGVERATAVERDGAARWSVPTDGGVILSALADSVVLSDGRLLSAIDGQERFRLTKPSSSLVAVLGSGAATYALWNKVTSPYFSEVSRIDPASGATLWERDLGVFSSYGPSLSSPVVLADGSLLLFRVRRVDNDDNYERVLLGVSPNGDVTERCLLGGRSFSGWGAGQIFVTRDWIITEEFSFENGSWRALRGYRTPGATLGSGWVTLHGSRHGDFRFR